MRELLLALGAMFVVAPVLIAQTEALPPIFAPRPVATEIAAPAPRRPAAPSEISDRMRVNLTERILSEAKPFEAPATAASSASAASGAPVLTADGAVLMRRFVVKSVPPPSVEVEPPALPPLIQFAPIERAGRRGNGISTTLFRLFDGRGLINFNAVKGGGQGVDHNREFTRAELEFSFRW